MEVSNIRREYVGAERQRVSADVGNDELWFEFPLGTDLPETVADSFAIMALAPSMLCNEPLRVAPEYPVSSTLVDNLAEVQKIFNCWNPAFRIVPIDARRASPGPCREVDASMFSGGVDSIHTLMRHRDRIEEAVLIGGFDMSVRREQMAAAELRNSELAGRFGARLCYVHTNQISWGAKTGVNRRFWNSAYLAAAVLPLRYRTVRIPSSHTYAALNPTGSHVVLDPLWSNGCTQVMHSDVDVRRTQKMQAIVTDPYIVDRLQVCWDSANENCGECGKCVRTMLTLNLLGRTGPFPRALGTREMRKIVVRDWEGADFIHDNRRFAREVGRAEVARALGTCLRRYQRRKCLREFDSGFLGGSVHRLRRYWSRKVRGRRHWVGNADIEM